MKDFIVDMLNSIGQGVNPDSMDLLTKSPTEFNKALYDTSVDIANNIGQPIAAAILSIVILIQFTTLAGKAEGDKQTMLKLICMTMIEACLILFFTQNATMLLSSITSIGDWSITSLQSLTGSIGTVKGENLGDALSKPIDDAGLKGQMAGLVLLLLPWLASKIGTVVVTIVIYLRFIQLYLMTAFAPVPVSFLVNEHTRQMGIGYFKIFAQVTFQTVMLYIALIFYRKIAIMTVKSSSFKDGMKFSNWCVTNFSGLILASLLLVAIVTISNKAAKAIMGD